MRAAISVIVRTQNAEQDLPVLVPLIFEAVQEGLLRELIFVDGGSNDDTAKIAEAIGAEMVSGGRAEGAAQAQGEWLLFLDQSDRPETGWTRAAADHLPERVPAVFAEGLLSDLRCRVLGPGRDRALMIRATDWRAGRIGRARQWSVRNRKA